MGHLPTVRECRSNMAKNNSVKMDVHGYFTERWGTEATLYDVYFLLTARRGQSTTVSLPTPTVRKFSVDSEGQSCLQKLFQCAIRVDYVNVYDVLTGHDDDFNDWKKEGVKTKISHHYVRRHKHLVREKEGRERRHRYTEWVSYSTIGFSCPPFGTSLYYWRGNHRATPS